MKNAVRRCSQRIWAEKCGQGRMSEKLSMISLPFGSFCVFALGFREKSLIFYKIIYQLTKIDKKLSIQASLEVKSLDISFGFIIKVL